MVQTYLEVGDNGHRDTRIVEGLEQGVGGSAIHCIHRLAQLAQELECFISKVNPDVAGVANVPVPASYTKKSFKIREGNGYPY
jgi:hypothetical protein